MERRVARMLADWRFLAATLMYAAYFFELGTVSHNLRTAILVGGICYVYFAVVFLVLTT
ncbi:MAG TPA: hypothetical protein VGS80_07130 [Ktedonobacterales bacterium]|nr:hypothetical protein [Ktedonobacterales bacterium]